MIFVKYVRYLIKSGTNSAISASKEAMYMRNFQHKPQFMYIIILCILHLFYLPVPVLGIDLSSNLRFSTGQKSTVMKNNAVQENILPSINITQHCFENLLIK